MNQFIQTHLWLIPTLPLVGVILNGVPTAAGFKLPRWYVYLIGCGSVFLSFCMGLGVWWVLKSMGVHESAEASLAFVNTLWSWMSIGSLNVNLAFLADPLSCVMVLVVTGVGFLIHVYSTGYMREDKDYARFFTYMNLFCFMMLTLVLADNILLLFVGWEGVGLCSYLLISFWYEQTPNASAGMKAFVVNRIGDFGLMIGLLLLFWTLFKLGQPTLNFVELKGAVTSLQGVHVLGVSVITLICIFLFIGATGKSAQIPLYVWLPDAMAGPTPVSALIHAATMVTAGVYLIVRMNFLFSLSPVALAIIATVGAFTAILGAIIGFAQNDIKKVLAYSTVSQLGYMFLALGAGAFSAGIFHLVTHAFFKACLFLGSGSVILAMHHEQDIRYMGGLRKYMPVTFLTFFLSTIAISGIAPFSGFFSKDEILWQVFARGAENRWYIFLWALGLTGAAGTAFYMMRLVVMTFFGKLRVRDGLDGHHGHNGLGGKGGTPKEQPWNVTVPLVVLAALAVVGGFLNVPYIINSLFGGHSTGILNHWLSSVVPHEAVHEVHAIEWVLMVVSVLVALAFMAIGYRVYTQRLEWVRSFVAKYSKFYQAVLNKFYVDEIYDKVIVQSVLNFRLACAWFDTTVIDALVNLTGKFTIYYSVVVGWFDNLFVDGAVNGVAVATNKSGFNLKKIQSGKIQHYAYVIVVGVVVVMVVRILV